MEKFACNLNINDFKTRLLGPKKSTGESTFSQKMYENLKGVLFTRLTGYKKAKRVKRGVTSRILECLLLPSVKEDFKHAAEVLIEYWGLQHGLNQGHSSVL